MSEASPIIECRDVTVNLGGRAVLERVSLRIEAGESLSITGASGSGKTTLLHCLAGLRRVDEGTIHLDGVDLTRARRGQIDSLRLNRMGIVFQSGELLAELTALENICLPAILVGVRRSEAEDTAAKLMDEFDLGATSDQFPASLSGGERQRVAVARALIQRPTVVLADEPTGALDSVNADKVAAALVRVAATRRATLVLVSHEAHLASLADRTIVMVDGRIAEDRSNR